MANGNPSNMAQKIFAHGETLKSKWGEAEAKFDTNNEHLNIEGKAVMERWETPFMHELAKVAASNGGRVLEIGFGLAISATKLQELIPKNSKNGTVPQHCIIECNSGVYETLQEWAKSQRCQVTGLHGLWEDVAPALEDNSFQGILYDAYPLSEKDWHTHQFNFIKKHAYRLLKPGGVLSYCNLTSFGELFKTSYSEKALDGVSAEDRAIQLFEETQVPRLIEAGFQKENISYHLFHLKPEEGCCYYSHNVFVVPRIIK